MTHSRPRSLARRRPGALLGAVFLLGVLAAGLAALPPAIAQIDNNQPTASMASVVDCIRSGADLGQPSEDYPRFVTTCFRSAFNNVSYAQSGGDPDNDANPSDGAVYWFGNGQPDAPGEPGHVARATVAQVGAAYGLAYSSGGNGAAPAGAPRDRRTFIGAYAKRMTRFGDGGPGAIYVDDATYGTFGLYVQIPDVVPGPDGAPGDPGDGSAPTFPNGATAATYNANLGGLHGLQFDSSTPPYVGASSLGDLDIDPDERYLYAVNLRNRRVYRIDTWSAAPQATVTALPDIMAAYTPCFAYGGGGNYRPFALHVTASDIYLGGVCSGETTGDRNHVTLRVDRYSLASGAWSPVISGAGLAAFDSQREHATHPTGWRAWHWSGGFDGDPHPNNVNLRLYPQPMLTDLEIGEGGALFLALRDRFGDTVTASGKPDEDGDAFYRITAGDLLRATPNGAGWNLSAAGGEFFADNEPAGVLGGNGHPENAAGAIAYVPGFHSGAFGAELVSTFLDPYQIESAGAAWFDTWPPGGPTAREELMAPGPAAFGKASGLGDVELLCAWRAVGNRVWLDSNNNGLQDGGESSLPGVRLQLIDASGSLLAEVETGSLVDASDGYRLYVAPFTSYTVRVDPQEFQPGGTLYGYGITTANAGDDTLDSDADAAGAVPIAAGPRSNIDLSYDIGVSQVPDLRIDKSAPATVRHGDPLVFTISYGNDGPALAADFTVIDQLPAGVSYTSASPPPTGISGQTLSWSLGSLAAGSGGSIVVNTVVVAPGLLVNSATASATLATPVSDSTTTAVLEPNVSIAKSGPAAATAGDAFAYTLSYASNGAAAADNVQVTDILPAGLSFVSASPPPTGVSGQTLSWSLGALAPGASGSISVQVQSDAGLADGAALANQAGISTTTPGDNPADNSATATTVVQRADVRIVKSSATLFPVLSGGQVVYDLDYSNAGPAAAAGVTLSDAVPARLAGVSWSCLNGCGASGTGNSIVLDLGALPAGASGRVRVTGTATTALDREDFTNTATISTSTPETDTGNNQSSVPGAVWTTDLQVIKLAQAQAVAGTTFTATLAFRNNGPALAAAARMTDTLPSGVSLVSAAPPPASAAGQVLAWDLGDLASGAGGSINLVLRAAPDLPDGAMVTNLAGVSTSGPDRDPGNDTASAATLVVARADLALVKSGPASPLRSGAPVTYTIAYRNDGPSLATGVRLRDTPPPGFTLDAAQPPATTVAGELIWDLGDMAPGQSGGITVTGLLTGDGISTLRVNMATVRSAGTTDPNPANNSDDHPLTVQRPDLSITKTDGQTYVQPGDVLTYTLTVRNNGAAVARGVLIRETPPLSGTVLAPAWTPAADGSYSLALGDLAAGAVVTRTFVVRMPASLPASDIVNTARVSDDGSAGPDPTPADLVTTDSDTPVAGRVGDTIWYDADEDGARDDGEAGIPGVTVQLLDPDSLAVLASAVTGEGGGYSFGDLRLGRYAVRLAPGTTTAAPYRGFRHTTPAMPTVALTVDQPVDLSLDIGLSAPPTTDVVLAYLRAERGAAGVIIRWRTLEEVDTVAFRVLRARAPERGQAVAIGGARSQGGAGGVYAVADGDPPAGPLYYWLLEQERDGSEHVYGPFSPPAMPAAASLAYLPIIAR